MLGGDKDPPRSRISASADSLSFSCFAKRQSQAEMGGQSFRNSGRALQTFSNIVHIIHPDSFDDHPLVLLPVDGQPHDTTTRTTNLCTHHGPQQYNHNFQ